MANETDAAHIEEGADSGNDVRVGMALEGGRGLTQTGQPVHEMLTLATMINSDYALDPSITYQALRDSPTAHPEINDFVRGVIWNDDPECELFNSNTDHNLEYSTGITWAYKFKFGGFQQHELIHRSHFGDLQWLHAMAQGKDAPGQTKERCYRWMQLMYSVATGQTAPDAPIARTAVSDLFNDPAHYATVGELLTHSLAGPAIIPHRALGSCFHVIQDSYAHGHTLRERLNPDAASGEADRWGAVLNFHEYNGQDTAEHKHFDHGADQLSVVDLAKPDSWNDLEGCRDALDRCITLANFWHRKASWDEVRRWLDEEVFAISPNATESDNTV